MLDVLDKTFMDYYKLIENLSIGEFIVKFKARESFRMYMPLVGTNHKIYSYFDNFSDGVSLQPEMLPRKYIQVEL